MKIVKIPTGYLFSDKYSKVYSSVRFFLSVL